VHVRPKTWVHSGWIAGIAGLSPARSMHIRLLCLLCVVQVAAFERS
jgi:hypothetical protein